MRPPAGFTVPVTRVGRAGGQAQGGGSWPQIT